MIRNDRDTRQAILAAAMAAFKEQGVQRTTVARIRTDAGVSNGSFFHHFATKEALAAELYVATLREYHEKVKVALSTATGAAAGIAAIIQTHMHWVTQQPDSARFLLDHAQADWLQLASEMQAQANAAFRITIDTWRMPLVAKGELPEQPYELLMAQLIGPAQFLCRRDLGGRRGPELLAMLPDLVDQAVRSLLRR